MRIAFVSLMTILPWGGSEDLWYKTARLALQQGHSVQTVTCRWDAVPSRIGELQQLGASTLFYDPRPRSLPSRIALKLHLWNEEAASQVDADVYIVSNGSTWDFIRFRHIVENYTKRGKPYIMISQHGFEHGDIVAAENRNYAQEIMSQAAAFFFVAHRNLNVAERQLAGSIPHARVISNPLNTREWAIKPYPVADELQLACVARLECAIKGQDVLLQALSNSQWANRSYRLRLYGGGPDREYLQALINWYGLQAKVTLEGYVDDVDAVWQANQVFVLPSFNEGTPLALLEAMMAGRPALVTDVGDNGRYVLPGQTGFLAAVASVNCLRDSLEQLWQARGELQRLGQQAFAHAMALTDLQPDATLLEAIEATCG
jgi:glycosyltransferase involved in cell wall biosynthesis